jgi:hypothetical protein
VGCGSFNDVICIKIRMVYLVNIVPERICTEAVVVRSRYCLSFWLEGLRNSTKTLSQDSRNTSAVGTKHLQHVCVWLCLYTNMLVQKKEEEEGNKKDNYYETV